MEEQLVLVELSGIIDSDFLSKCEKKCKILGIDTERPILQLDSYVFAGKYEGTIMPDAVGNCDIFEEDSVVHVDLDGNNKTMLKYKCHTVMKRSVTRTLLTEKKEGEGNTGNVEWLQIKSDFSCRSNMICSFVHENEEVVPATLEKPWELKQPESQGKENSSLIYDQEEGPDLEMEDSESVIALPSSETDTSIFMEAQDSDLEITPR
ncbi:general transcription factor 3C polypeptide 6-like [Erinaceus europaeus]|uniref:General transcription factor 3C polypeptide 6-like n=1 Tax=Erinaceus europaeus TaxID=9365 RepID=A0ABM3XDF9_ERIEU|nr:general transcription factor 3C polypeptide 6-like [Erinaceus europaeus]